MQAEWREEAQRRQEECLQDEMNFDFTDELQLVVQAVLQSGSSEQRGPQVHVMYQSAPSMTQSNLPQDHNLLQVVENMHSVEQRALCKTVGESQYLQLFHPITLSTLKDKRKALEHYLLNFKRKRAEGFYHKKLGRKVEDNSVLKPSPNRICLQSFEDSTSQSNDLRVPVEFCFVSETLLSLNSSFELLSKFGFDHCCGTNIEGHKGVQHPWLLIGDFNQVLRPSETLSTNLNIPGAEDFENFPNDAGLINLHPQGNWFTWTNGRLGEDAIWERLDRAVCNVQWLNVFPQSSMFCLPLYSSNHSPFVVTLHENVPRKPRPHRFEAMWLLEDSCNQVVRNAWNINESGSLAYLFASKSAKEIVGIRFARRGPMISHLMYADDTILFFKADDINCRAIKYALSIYSNLAGQHLNKDKSFLVFSPNTSSHVKRYIATELGVPISSRIGRYLRTIIDNSRNSPHNFHSMVEKVNAKLAGWKAKTLSQAGRLTLIKAVLQPLNMYNMSSDFIPKKYCNKMDVICTNFFWDFQRDKPAMHLLNRNHIFAPRDRGGLGLRHSDLVNRALVTKQV
ncbi:reverse transcriptase [Senna tora]|uniref:Reverse transcriptase n=1 Tax=Senna tora TaxID=362788 RepID=A0A834TFN8_9FABA|nr:reverse transcriptase [Senna tora]